MVVFKLKSQSNLETNYKSGQEVYFNFSKMDMSEVEFIGHVKQSIPSMFTSSSPNFIDSSDLEINQKIKESEYLKDLTFGFNAKFASYSRIDGCPIFVVNTDDIREMKIDEIFK